MHPVLNLAARSGLEGSTAGKKDGTLTARLIIVRLYERIFFSSSGRVLAHLFARLLCLAWRLRKRHGWGWREGGMHAPAGAVLSICGENYRATWCGGQGGTRTCVAAS